MVITCNTCQGRGKVKASPFDPDVTCPACAGAGTVETDARAYVAREGESRAFEAAYDRAERAAEREMEDFQERRYERLFG